MTGMELARVPPKSFPTQLGSRDRMSQYFFIILVDGMFTTFIAHLFTNVFDAIGELRVRSCVSHARHAD
jgi:hypothetical protein